MNLVVLRDFVLFKIYGRFGDGKVFLRKVWKKSVCFEGRLNGLLRRWCNKKAVKDWIREDFEKFNVARQKKLWKSKTKWIS